MSSNLVNLFMEVLYNFQLTFTKSEITTIDLLQIIDNHVSIFHKLIPLYINENIPNDQLEIKKNETIKILEQIANKMKTEIENNKEQFIYKKIKEINDENKKENLINTNEEAIEIEDQDNEDNKIMEENKHNNNINVIHNVINITIEDNNVNRFNNLHISEVTEYKLLFLDMTKYKLYYRNNYIFKTTDATMIGKIYTKLKEDHTLKRTLIVNQLTNNISHYILFVECDNSFNINKFMVSYVNSEYSHLSINERYNRIRTLGHIILEL